MRRLQPGDEWHFLLKSPLRKLGGYGVFQEYRDLSIQDAWQTYDVGNGVSPEAEFVSRCRMYSERNSIHPVTNGQSIIGCVVLSDLEFHEDDEYLDLSSIGLEFARQIVKFKYFDEAFPRSTEQGLPVPSGGNEFTTVASDPTEYSRQRRKKRKGQQGFRKKSIRAHRGRCAVTGESHRRVLEATHIEPYINEAINHIQNGMLLRVDIHPLMDEGLLALNDDMTLLVSSKLNNSSYVKFAGHTVGFPNNPAERPSTHAVALHRRERFQA